MAYAPPSYDAIDFSGSPTGYVAPAYDAVAFLFEPPTSDVAAFSSHAGSALSIRAGSLFLLSGASGFTPEVAQRAFDAPTVTSFTAVTDLRAPSISSGSVFFAQYGAIFSISAASSVSMDGRIPMYSAFGIAAATSSEFVWTCLTNSKFSSAGRTAVSPGRGYIQAVGFSSVARSGLSAESAKKVAVRFASAASSGTSFSARLSISSIFTSYGASSCAFQYNKLLPRAFSSASGTTADWIGLRACVSIASAYSSSHADFYSSFDYAVVNPYQADADVVFVTQRQNDVVATV